MKIEIDKYKGIYRADLIDLPGSPPLGIGHTSERAIVNLFRSILLSDEYKDFLTPKLLLEDYEIVITEKR